MLTTSLHPPSGFYAVLLYRTIMRDSIYLANTKSIALLRTVHARLLHVSHCATRSRCNVSPHPPWLCRNMAGAHMPPLLAHWQTLPMRPRRQWSWPTAPVLGHTTRLQGASEPKAQQGVGWVALWCRMPLQEAAEVVQEGVMLKGRLLAS